MIAGHRDGLYANKIGLCEVDAIHISSSQDPGLDGFRVGRLKIWLAELAWWKERELEG